MSIGTVVLVALAILCLFSVGERVCTELGWPRFLAVVFLVCAAIFQTLPGEIKIGGGTVSPAGVGFVLVAGVWAVYRSLVLGERIARMWLSILLCGLWMLLLLMLWNRQGILEPLLPGAACGVLAALIADSRPGMLVYSLLGALLACILYVGYSLITGGINMLELGTGYSWNLFAVSLWCALWFYELKDAIKRFVFIKIPKNRSAP
ncbi:MAG: hypothetical protein ACOYU3_02210 [Bacillota bacterium]